MGFWFITGINEEPTSFWKLKEKITHCTKHNTSQFRGATIYNLQGAGRTFAI